MRHPRSFSWALNEENRLVILGISRDTGWLCQMLEAEERRGEESDSQHDLASFPKEIGLPLAMGF